MKERISGSILVILMLIIITLPACTSTPDNAAQISNTIVPESQEEALTSIEDNSTLYYVVSFQEHGAEFQTTELEGKNEYESYRIDIVTQNAELLNSDASISFNPKDCNANSRIDETIVLPIFTSDEMYQTYADAKESGNIAMPRQLSANIFFNEDEGSTQTSTEDGTISQSNCTYCIAYVSIVDEYNNGKTRKRHNVGFSLAQKSPNFTAKYISTTRYDDEPDILGLTWSIGGATTASASTTTAQVIYTYQSNDMVYQNFKSKAQMTAHFSYCTGNGVGFEVPDTMNSDDSTYRACYPSLYTLGCTTGWYDVGSYNGVTGHLKGALYHTFQNKPIFITPFASLGGISFSLSGGTENDLEVGWAEGLLSPD